MYISKKTTSCFARNEPDPVGAWPGDKEAEGRGILEHVAARVARQLGEGA